MSNREQEKSRKKLDDAFANFASDLVESEEKDKETRKDVLQTGIENREDVDQKTLKSSRLVTERLSSIRQDAGLSAFVGTSGKIKSPRFRRGEFISLLARELLLIGRDEMDEFGGVVSMNKLEAYFAEKRDNWELREGDIKQGIELLIKENMIPGFQQVKDEVSIIHFKPVELTDDTQKVLTMALGIETSISKLRSILGWQESRLDTALKRLEKDGIAIIDNDEVYFPGLN